MTGNPQRHAVPKVADAGKAVSGDTKKDIEIRRLKCELDRVSDEPQFLSLIGINLLLFMVLVPILIRERIWAPK